MTVEPVRLFLWLILCNPHLFFFLAFAQVCVRLLAKRQNVSSLIGIRNSLHFSIQALLNDIRYDLGGLQTVDSNPFKLFDILKDSGHLQFEPSELSALANLLGLLVPVSYSSVVNIFCFFILFLSNRPRSLFLLRLLRKRTPHNLVVAPVPLISAILVLSAASVFPDEPLHTPV